MAATRKQRAIRVGLLAVLATAGVIATSSRWGVLFVLPALPLVVARGAPSTEYLCALIGIVFGFLLMPAQTNRPTNDLRDYFELLWILGGAVAGALLGTIVAWADRRIVSRR